MSSALSDGLFAFLKARGVSLSEKQKAVLHSLSPVDRHLTNDSREVRKGSVFVAQRGGSVDGHSFIPEVAEKASLIFADISYDIPDTLSPLHKEKILRVNDTSPFSRELASVFYGHPSRKMKVIGVTGTNGKTTSTYLLEALYRSLGKKIGVIGTIEIRYDTKTGPVKIPSVNTTPDAVALQAILHLMAEAGLEVVAMEVSSHALQLDRLRGLELDSLLFTNITPDHLDFHKTMDAYLDAKLKGFDLLAKSGKSLKKAVVWENIQEREKIVSSINRHRGKTFLFKTYGVNAPKAQLNFELEELSLSGSIGRVILEGRELGECRLSLVGEFNILNALGCLSEWLDESKSEKEIYLQLKAGFAAMNQIQVPGRLEAIPTPQGGFVYVDYAHTPDALENILTTLKKLPQKKLVCVFGCGGDRDKTKRPVMGKIAGKLADSVIVTSDNPRTEDPASILAMIEEGIQGVSKNYRVIADREEAIRTAVRELGKDEILALAGKGHEDYQILGKTKIHFDDREMVRKYMN